MHVSREMLDERRLLAQYARELGQLEEQITQLQRRRAAVMGTVQALQTMLRVSGIDPATVVDAEPWDTEPKPPERSVEAAMSGVLGPSEGTTTTLGAALHLLRTTHELMGAKDIQRALAEAGVQVNYYTLYKALVRESGKKDGRAMKVGNRFGTTEATNGGESS